MIVSMQPFSAIRQHYSLDKEQSVSPVFLSSKHDYFEKRSISFKGEVFDYEARLKELLEARPWVKRKLNIGADKIKKQVNLEMAAVCLHEKAKADEAEDKNKKLIEAQEKIIKAKEEALNAEREKNKILQQRIEDQQNFNAQCKELEETIRKKNESDAIINKQTENISSEKKRLNSYYEENARRLKIERGKGWDKLAGSNEEFGIGRIKKQLEENFINQLSLEKNGAKVSIPNGILFYGPKSTGKTYFAEAFAQQAKCNFLEVDTFQLDDDVLIDLKKALEKSKELFESTNERSVILLDEFDSIAQLGIEEKRLIEEKGKTFLNETNAGVLKSFLSNCADNYKATIFMTTNHPLNIDSSILTDKNCLPMEVYLGPPEWGDVESMFKYHLREEGSKITSYEKIVETAMDARREHSAFSSQRIKIIADKCIKFAKENCLKVTENDIINKMKEVGPDISPQKLREFAETIIKLSGRWK